MFCAQVPASVGENSGNRLPPWRGEAGGSWRKRATAQPIFSRWLHEGAVFLSQTLRQSIFPGRKKNLGGSKSHLVRALEGVFEAGKLTFDPAFTVGR